MEATKKQQHTAVGTDVVIQRVFRLPVGKVWQALTVPEYFKKWWGPRGFTSPYSKMEAQKGGRYLNCMQAPDGTENWSTGVVQEFVPEKKLVITDSFSDSEGNIISGSDYGLPGNWPREMLITFELSEADGATKLKLTHQGIPREAHDDCVTGWTESLDKLEENIK
jgi:uncharacterized protein YndB with AHSA1/START domain